MVTNRKISSIKKLETPCKVYDLHHNISPGAFVDEQPNILTDVGLISNCGRHAGGVVLTDSPIEKQNMPLIIGGKGEKRSLQTPWTEGVNFRMLEHFGFLKFDFLALGTLRMFENTVRKILKKHHGIKDPSFEQINEWFQKTLSPDVNNFDDLEVYKHVFWNGNFFSIFQFVKPNTQEFMRKMKPVSIRDIAIATSIHRPGPLGLKVDKLFLNNRANPDKIQYEHPLLEDVLKPTSGLLIFQEQLQLIYAKLCGMPLDETDSVRKAFTKKETNNKEKAAKEREKLKKEFVEKTKAFANLDPRKSSEFFDKMEALVAYSFNLSHAISYSIATYQCAYFLKYHPDEWITSALDYAALEKGKVVGQEDPKTIAMREAQKLGYKFSKPDINFSTSGYEMHPKQEKVIVPGLTTISGIGDAALKELEQYRPYESIEDLFINKDGTKRHSKFNRKSLANMIKLEALDSLGIVGSDKQLKNYKQLNNAIVDRFDDIKKVLMKKKNNDIKPVLESFLKEEEIKNEKDWSKPEKIGFWMELAGGVDLSLILDDEYLEVIQEMDLISIDKIPVPDFLENPKAKEKADAWFIVRKVIAKTTKFNKPYLELVVNGENFTDRTLKLWGVNDAEEIVKKKIITKDSIMCGQITLDTYGFSAFYSGVAPIVEAHDYLQRQNEEGLEIG